MEKPGDIAAPFTPRDAPFGKAPTKLYNATAEPSFERISVTVSMKICTWIFKSIMKESGK